MKYLIQRLVECIGVIPKYAYCPKAASEFSTVNSLDLKELTTKVTQKITKYCQERKVSALLDLKVRRCLCFYTKDSSFMDYNT